MGWIDLQAKEAIPILEQAVERLESAEPSWTNCRACPHSGKCCDGATGILIFPEESAELSDYLKKNPEILIYAKKRLANKKGCYFHDPSSEACLVHTVRPILCRWTPYALFSNSDIGGVKGYIRSKDCSFTAIDSSNKVIAVSSEMVEVTSRILLRDEGGNKKYLILQNVLGIRPLLGRSNEMQKLEDLLTAL
ncbi:TPA: YkgJ family cysteine cluster protein [Pseudomonas aeruginosa]